MVLMQPRWSRSLSGGRRQPDCLTSWEYYSYYYCIFRSLFKATMRQEEDRKHLTLRRSKFTRLVNIWHAVASVTMLTCAYLFRRYLLKKHTAACLATFTANEKACFYFPADISELQMRVVRILQRKAQFLLLFSPSFAKPQTFTAFA